ncbi:MAG: hypothetical protein UU53_C0008G0023 [Candidatus Curtissbacteria bacterium GW2011_GWC2_41_21]|nr:MAG: hypothetical protein UU53_C0008G0023 [Candidatus Curtissbacteria bacterium GW2011_GWC2_41_21]
MIIGCIAPILIFGFFLLFGFTNNSLIVLLFLLCPLSHILMMRGHREKHH